MLNDRDDKHEGSDDSEYHFSDDDVDYEAEPDSSKPASVTEAHADSARSTGGSKRLLIGLAVFFGLVFIAYKMVAPSSSVPATDIAPQTSALVAASPVQQQATPQQVAHDMSATQTVAGQPAAIPQSAPVHHAMPQMIPVQTSVTTPTVMASTMPPQVGQTANVAEKSLAMENAKLTSQLQAEYAQRINDYQSQNRNLQDQVQTLNTRVANMESEMNQLIQTLTQQFQGGASASAAIQPPASVDQAGPPPRIPYTVQAIIPGRAWLRAKNAHTV